MFYMYHAYTDLTEQELLLCVICVYGIDCTSTCRYNRYSMIVSHFLKLFIFQSCLTVFKSMSNVEKTVEKCQINLNVQKARLIFKLYCKHGKFYWRLAWEKHVDYWYICKTLKVWWWNWSLMMRLNLWCRAMIECENILMFIYRNYNVSSY